ncbi:unnamed protein product [marine sediment metagenome]|uniref:Uncharacterized protein n=1 Tax=marine sediment metagenome TaxID=412755 RepID=X1V0A3_9ZZZZ
MNHLEYPLDFPVQEFNLKLDEILKDEPSKIEEKVLQDHIYDILDKKGILTVEHIVRIFAIWPETIEMVMLSRNYGRSVKSEEEDTYIPIDPLRNTRAYWKKYQKSL